MFCGFSQIYFFYIYFFSFDCLIYVHCPYIRVYPFWSLFFVPLMILFFILCTFKFKWQCYLRNANDFHVKKKVIIRTLSCFVSWIERKDGTTSRQEKFEWYKMSNWPYLSWPLVSRDDPLSGPPWPLTGSVDKSVNLLTKLSSSSAMMFILNNNHLNSV